MALALGVLVGWTQRASVRGWFLERPFRTELPSAQPATETVLALEQPSATPAQRTALSPAAPVGAPASARAVNLAVPFAPQAPTAQWTQPYQDACEEAAIIMIERFFRGVPLPLPEMDAEILRMVKFQEERYGFFKDSNAAETARLTEAFYPHLSAKVVYNVTADDIRGALAQGTPVLALVDGRKLGNPFYTAPGPERHAIVIKGVTGDKFITNDPGTRRGADFAYPIATVLNALEDYDGGSPGTGKPVVILLTPKKR
ncbi:MAG: C39 family peptidase [bacterium]|nr:C39 family peptidase [bacterium]